MKNFLIGVELRMKRVFGTIRGMTLVRCRQQLVKRFSHKVVIVDNQ
jgi:hypothetical protein